MSKETQPVELTRREIHIIMALIGHQAMEKNLRTPLGIMSGGNLFDKLAIALVKLPTETTDDDD